MNKTLQVVYLSTEKLKPYDRNSRIHSNEQIQQVADSIREFGFNNPILIDDNFVVIAGHCRLEASKLLGLTEVPTIKLSNMTEAQKRAYIIADNKLSENAGWDVEILKDEFDFLGDENFNSEITGFSFDEIEQITSGVGEIDDEFFTEQHENHDGTDKDYFQESFCFPIEYKEIIKNYFKKVSKEEIAMNILKEAKNDY